MFATLLMLGHLTALGAVPEQVPSAPTGSSTEASPTATSGTPPGGPEEWQQRNGRFRAQVLGGAGISLLVGAPLSIGLRSGARVSLVLIPQFRFDWTQYSPVFLGGDLGLQFHLHRRFAMGVGVQGGAVVQSGMPATGAMGFTVTPAVVSLGDREQHRIWLYVPVTYRFAGNFWTGLATLVPSVVLAYSFVYF